MNKKVMNINIMIFRNESIRPFCNQISHGLTETSHLKYECSENKEAVVLCNLMRHEHKLPYQYRV